MLLPCAHQPAASGGCGAPGSAGAAGRTPGQPGSPLRAAWIFGGIALCWCPASSSASSSSAAFPGPPAPQSCPQSLTQLVALRARRHAVSSRPGDATIEAFHGLWDGEREGTGQRRGRGAAGGWWLEGRQSPELLSFLAVAGCLPCPASPTWFWSLGGMERMVLLSTSPMRNSDTL